MSIGKGPNVYLDASNQYFICALSIETKDNINDWKNVVFYVGSAPGSETYSSNNFDIEEINADNKREMKLHFASLAGNDILDKVYLGMDPQTEIKEAFEKVNTSIVWNDADVGDGTNVLPQPSPGFTFTSVEDQKIKLIDWLIANDLKLAWGYGNQSTMNKQYLVGLGSFTTQNQDLIPQTGVTLRRIVPGTEEVMTSWSIVWENKTFSLYDLNYSYMVASVAVHELGHARGGLLHDNTEYYMNALTDVTHNLGHNGIHKKTCVMKYNSNMTPDEAKEWILEPNFCEGHKQMLYNVKWTEDLL